MPDVGDFIRRSRRSPKIAVAAPGKPGDFRLSRRSAYKIARCVTGLRKKELVYSDMTIIDGDFSAMDGFNTKRNRTGLLTRNSKRRRTIIRFCTIKLKQFETKICCDSAKLQFNRDLSSQLPVSLRCDLVERRERKSGSMSDLYLYLESLSKTETAQHFSVSIMKNRLPDSWKPTS